MAGFYAKEYKKKANSILKESIRSAIFIDENAIEPFCKIPSSKSISVQQTQELSAGLFSHFDKQNIAFEIHRFVSVDKAKAKIKNKDIVLLDWHLDGNHSGEELALELLEEIFKEEHIHFCCIYTNSPEDTVINNCVSYFSGYTDSFCNEILEVYELDEELVQQVNPYLDRIFTLANPNDKNKIDTIAKELKRINGFEEKISALEGFGQYSKLKEKLHCLAYAVKSNLRKSKSSSTPKIDFLNKAEHVFTIRNTVVIILKKNAADSKNLFNKILNEIIQKHNSYLLMLGLEMQTFIRRGCAFITGNTLDVKNETIAFHWSQNVKNQNELSFEEFVKQIIIDHVDSRIKGSKLILLDKEKFLQKRQTLKFSDTKQLARINTFYNGNKTIGDRSLNYGDIFFSDKTKKYYLCITALCDCLHPQNIKNKFYFVEGTKFNLIKAIDLSDEAFISYINEEECISWIRIGRDSPKDKHRPVYIKPIQMYIPKSIITENKIEMLDWGENGEVVRFELQYKFTLRSQYTQRLSNHAFTYPMRVGIDFLKISK